MWSVQLEQRKNLELMVSKKLGFHQCNEDDYRLFYEPSDQNRDFLFDLKMRSALFCLDNQNDLEI